MKFPRLSKSTLTRIKQLGLGVLAALLVSAGLLPGTATAVPITVTITDTATGSATPGTAPHGTDVINGDFTIVNQVGSTTGDGSNERTLWTFDFNADPNLAAFTAPGMGLTSALLTLTIHSTDPFVKTDDVVINSAGFDPIFPPELATLSVPTDPAGFTFTVELLDYYSAGDIMSLFNGSGNTLPFKYSDDAIVSFAKLELTATELPEPTSLLLLGSGLVGFAAWSLRKRQTA